MASPTFFCLSAQDIAYLQQLQHALYAATATPRYRSGDWLRDQAQALEALLAHAEPLDAPAAAAQHNDTKEQPA